MYKIPEEIRKELKNPVDGYIEEKDLKKIKEEIISVGDMVTLTLDKYGIEPKICIVDYKTRRGEIQESEKEKIKKIGEETIKVKNPPGTISDELWYSVNKSLKSNKKTKIEVDGEEDLSVFPCVYLSEKKTTIIYGIPEKGIAFIKSNEKNKKIASELLKKMEKI